MPHRGRGSSAHVALADHSSQVIVLEHADFDEAWFRDAVVERWRDGEALIPRTWYEE